MAVGGILRCLGWSAPMLCGAVSCVPAPSSSSGSVAVTLPVAGGAPGTACDEKATPVGCWSQGGLGQKVVCIDGRWSDRGLCRIGEKCAVIAAFGTTAAEAQCVVVALTDAGDAAQVSDVTATEMPGTDGTPTTDTPVFMELLPPADASPTDADDIVEDVPDGAEDVATEVDAGEPDVSDTQPEVADTPDEITVPICGDNVCNGNENAEACPGDCPAKCGDSLCTGAENAQDCPGDCPTKCGDSLCTGPENNVTCPGDCTAKCGNVVCESGETPGNCGTDCKPVCGDKACDVGETMANCPDDCKLANCGDGKCVSPENYQTCATDCAQSPVGCKGNCNLSSKTAQGLPCSCEKTCTGNCCADITTYCTCGKQCTGKICGADGCGGSCGTCAIGATCDASGQCKTTPKCGDSFCDPPETNATCPVDCKPTSHPCDVSCGAKAVGFSCYCDAACKSNGDCCTATGAKANTCTGSSCASCK